MLELQSDESLAKQLPVPAEEILAGEVVTAGKFLVN